MAWPCSTDWSDADWRPAIRNGIGGDFCINLGGPGVLAQMVQLCKQFCCSIVAAQEVPEDEVHKYGVIAGQYISDDLIRVENMIEKPAKKDAPGNLAIIGRYILTPDIFDLIHDTRPGKGGEIQITDALTAQAQRGCVMAYKFKRERFDCGSIPGFIEARNYCYDNLFT